MRKLINVLLSVWIMFTIVEKQITDSLGGYRCHFVLENGQKDRYYTRQFEEKYYSFIVGDTVSASIRFSGFFGRPGDYDIVDIQKINNE